jgi:outer membrane biosynthesis protein TonB
LLIKYNTIAFAALFFILLIIQYNKIIKGINMPIIFKIKIILITLFLFSLRIYPSTTIINSQNNNKNNISQKENLIKQTPQKNQILQNQTLNQIKKIPIPLKKTVNKKIITTPIKKPTVQPKKITVITNLNDLTKALEKFHQDQKKQRETTRSNACNQYINIADKCPCVGVSCACPIIPKFVTI